MGPDDARDTGLIAARDALVSLVRHYHRLEVSGALVAPEEPVLFVANHGFGSLFDLDVFTSLAALQDLQLDRPVTILVHQLAWTVGLGGLLERIGAEKASRQTARRALDRGEHVLVFPGGDVDAFKSRKDKNRIVFEGRIGFARLALEAGVPVVPIVTAGAGDTLLVLSDGQGLARLLRLDELLRLKALPVSLTIPWGLNLGIAGFAPYLPLPVRLRTRVLPAISARADEDAADLAHRIEAAMQAALDDLTGE